MGHACHPNVILDLVCRCSLSDHLAMHSRIQFYDFKYALGYQILLIRCVESFTYYYFGRYALRTIISPKVALEACVLLRDWYHENKMHDQTQYGVKQCTLHTVLSTLKGLCELAYSSGTCVSNKHLIRIFSWS
jgi:hypothetical protein